MESITTRFGIVEYDPAQVLLFPDGLPGFEVLRRFLVMPNPTGGPFFWIQSVEEGDVALILTDPTNFFPEYAVRPDTEELAGLNIGEEDDCHALSVVTVREDKSVTLNLAGPILFAPKTNRAIQVVLQNSRYSSREPLPRAENTQDRQAVEG
ncbi:MAG TPA: flagellar assembly protein FliW [Desulfomicrobiaceae bacterium]|nr:flagellar assembly protein FliW [Desulfomicrobiaceae bacterium]